MRNSKSVSFSVSSRSAIDPRRLGRVLAALTVFVGVLEMGCVTGGGRSTTASSSSGGGFEGNVTIENRSQLNVCSVMMMTDSAKSEQAVELSSGQSIQIAISGPSNRMYLTECGGERSLYGHPMNWLGNAQGRSEMLQGLSNDRIVLYDPGQAPSDASDHRAIELNPRPISDWIFFTPYSDASLTESLHSALLERARQERWSESFELSIPLSDWGVLRNRRTGIITGRSVQAAGFARWSDGHCTMQAFGYEQSYDGSDFSGPIRVGASTQLEIPCAALTYAAGLVGATTSSPSSSGPRPAPASRGGGSCTNTCSSANDGECDDGGPRSQYAVCSLGTDCADCGSR